jgi:hypothetical protein
MERQAGVWIDHRKAVIVILTDEGQKTRLVIGGRIVSVETVDKMTDRQITAKVRQRFRG